MSTARAVELGLRTQEQVRPRMVKKMVLPVPLGLLVDGPKTVPQHSVP